MRLFPRDPLQFVSIQDDIAGNLSVTVEGVSVPYQRGVYYASRYQESLTYALDDGEVVGPPPTVKISRPEDVVIPEAMQPGAKAPKAPAAPRAPATTEK